MTQNQINQILQARTEAKEHEAKIQEEMRLTKMSEYTFNLNQAKLSMYAGQRIAYEHTLNILEVDFE